MNATEAKVTCSYISLLICQYRHIIQQLHTSLKLLEMCIKCTDIAGHMLYLILDRFQILFTFSVYVYLFCEHLIK